MEPILGLIVIIVILLILGIGPDVIIFGAVMLLIGLTVLTELFFICCVVRLIFSKGVTARFTKIDKRARAKFDTAYYMTEDGELPNIFPCEVIMKDKLYRPDREVRLRLDAGKKYVYDRNALLTIFFGTVLCALLIFFLAAGMYIMFGSYP